jgi:hypothetical protein
MTTETPPPPTPAVHFLAPPGHRQDLAGDRYGALLVGELESLHRRCLAGVTGHPLDPGAELVAWTSAGRVRFVGGGASAPVLDADLVDAVVHAARAGYRLCGRRGAKLDSPRHPCWLPADHPGDCEHRGWWRWSLLYGYRGPVTLVCTSCTPHRHEPAPDDCPHR